MNFPITFVTRRDKMDAAELLGTNVEVIEAVTAVEARGSGFIAQTDWPTLLFEGHIFHRQTGGRFSDDHPTISHPRWTKKNYRGGRREYDRLSRAIALCGEDPSPALKSCSWGMFQIMGFNHETSGFAAVTDFVNAMATGEREQLIAFCQFVLSHDAMARALRDQDWAGFARRYNGPGYKANRYDSKLAAAFAKARRQAQDPDGDAATDQRNRMVQVQAALNAAIGAGLSPDGWIGAKTRAALEAFQKDQALPVTGDPDAATIEALGLDGDFTFALRNAPEEA
jgi:hypothetical protein